MKRNARGSNDATYTEEGKVTIAHWNDNSFATLLTSWHVVELQTRNGVQELYERT